MRVLVSLIHRVDPWWTELLTDPLLAMYLSSNLSRVLEEQRYTARS